MRWEAVKDAAYFVRFWAWAEALKQFMVKSKRIGWPGKGSGMETSIRFLLEIYLFFWELGEVSSSHLQWEFHGYFLVLDQLQQQWK